MVVTHNSVAWKSAYDALDFYGQKNQRIAIYGQTQKAALEGFKVGEEVCTLDEKTVEAMQKGTKYIKNPTQVATTKAYTTTVKVYEGDTLDITKQLQERGLKPVVLNMSCTNTPGGGVLNGARAQEESLYRRSNYFQSTYPNCNKNLNGYYHVPEFGAVYSPSVLVFRESIDKGFAFCKPYTVDFIASAAYRIGRSQVLPIGYEENMKKKIRAIFLGALETDHDTVVLGAWGCGAYRNSPKKIAELFKAVIEEEFTGKFKEIAFAIINDHNSEQNGTDNVKVFSDVLNNLETKA
jgi:uncharacterized protein (TIGR02452 family)